MRYEIERLTKEGWAAVRLSISSAEIARQELAAMREADPKTPVRIVEVMRTVVFAAE